MSTSDDDATPPGPPADAADAGEQRQKVAGSGSVPAKGRVRAALLLAAGHCVAATSRQTGIPLRTLYRLIKRPEFGRMVRRARGVMLDRAAGDAARSLRPAAATLRGLLGSSDEGVRLRAAKAILEQGLRLVGAVEIEQRMAELESRLGEKGR